MVLKSSFAPAIREYLDFRKGMGLSSRQDKHMESFDRYCYSFHPEANHLSREVVRGWVSHEISQGRSGLYNKIGSLRLFARYLGNGAYVVPTCVVPKKPKSTPYILTDDELSNFFEAVDNMQPVKDPLVNILAPVLLRLLYTCGLRPHEGRLIKRKDINFQTGEIIITKTKGRKERLVVMSDDMLDLCKKYDATRGIWGHESDYFFPRSDGKPLINNQLSGIVGACWCEANPDTPKNKLPRLRPYDLRHRFASTLMHKWLDEERDLYVMLPYMRAYMGHENFSVTASYIHILPDNLLRSPGVDWDALDKIGPKVSVWKS